MVTRAGERPAAGRSAGSSGGQANEGGSLYRSGVAAYLAAHGLKGRGIEAAGYPEAGPAPVALSFETSEAVDDIRCDLADGTAIALQAKRTCGADEQLRKTVDQWARHLPDLRTGDRMGLVTANPRGPVRALGAALARRRRSLPGPFSGPEQQALDAVRDRFPSGTSALAGDQILDAALAMTVATETAWDSDFRYAASLLDGTVVASGSGSAAVRALQRAFQEQAAAGTGSGMDEWLEVLAAADLDVFPDADGPAGTRRRAELDAVTAHRRRLAADDGLLEYSLLADDLPPLQYEQLADSFQVSVVRDTRRGGDVGFLALARRWPRMLLTGLPGTGKSTALQQLAARWAAAPQAPVPILVPLLEIAQRRPRSASDVTLAVLVEAATMSAPEHQRVPLRRALSRAVECGEAVLLLDGLDECRDLRAVVADGLAVVAGELPRDTGMLLTTRDSGRAASGKLGFPEARMAEPSRLERPLSLLLKHVARQRIPEGQRDRWIREREDWLGEARRDHSDLWQIPLLATLITLLAAQREPAALPENRARLLTEVVRDSVQKWERTRGLGIPGGPPVVRAEMLTDGYSEIAHGLGGSGSLPVPEASRLVAARLSHHWGLAPGEAEATAGDILRFWDDHVGVFVSSPASGRVEARSRVFTEVGDAMWVVRQDHDAQAGWVKVALADEDRREPLILAASMSREVATVLASQALRPQADPAGALILADAAAEGAVLSADTRSALLTGLARAVAHPPENGPGDDCRDLPGEQPNRGTQKDSGAGPADRAWPYIRRAATLRLPPGLRNERRASLAALELTGGQFVVATALAVLADARADCRVRLEPIDTAVVLQLLDPATYRNRKTLLPGHVTAAEQAISYLAQLGPGAPDAIFQIAAHGTYGLYQRVRVRLNGLGFTDQQARTAGRAVRRLFRGVPDITEDWDQLFEAVVPVSDCRPLSHEEIWRLPDLAALCDVVDPLHATLISIHDAYTVDRARLPGVLRAAARAAGIDLPTLSGQAAAALASWKTGDHGVADALLAPPPSPPAACLLTRLTQADIDILIDALGVGSAWIADIAGYVLTQDRDQSIAEAVASRMPGNSPDSIRRRNIAVVVLANTADSACEADSMLNSADPSVRAGAAVASRLLAECGSGGPWEPVIARALTDDDMTVRLACRDDADIRSAAFWSCPWCARINDIAATACASCRRGKTLRADRLPRAVLHQKAPSAESPPQASV